MAVMPPARHCMYISGLLCTITRLALLSPTVANLSKFVLPELACKRYARDSNVEADVCLPAATVDQQDDIQRLSALRT